MKVLQLSTDDFSGGASRAAYRLHLAFADSDIDSHMRVLEHQTANVRIIAGRAPRTFEQKVKNKLQNLWREHSNRNWKTDNLILHSFGHASAGLVDELNCSDVDIINLHWIAKLLSVQDIGKLTKPIVWTLHDMWAFCGGEHVAPDNDQSRFRKGYLSGNRPQGESGPDLNRQTWETKLRAWANLRFNIVAPSQWMARCVRESVLFKDSPVTVIPNPLEMSNLWKPIPQRFARKQLGLDPDKLYVLSGSAGGMPHLKGEDLLRLAMNRVVASCTKEVELLIFGQYCPANSVAWPCPVRWLGPVRDDHVMTTIYSAADVMMVPSRQDNLPNTAVEAHACGTPVVGFNIGGMPDIVSHQKTGWLARPFDTQELADGILWVLNDRNRWAELSSAARSSAFEKFSPEVVTRQYMDVYESALRK